MKEKTAIPEPIHKHDCDVCIYLGSYQLVVDYDLYLCEASKTVIARWGSEGYQYDSGLALIQHNVFIAVAARRALAYYMGIINYWEV
jgi:hypothetical protein